MTPVSEVIEVYLDTIERCLADALWLARNGASGPARAEGAAIAGRLSMLAGGAEPGSNNLRRRVSGPQYAAALSAVWAAEVRKSYGESTRTRFRMLAISLASAVPAR